MEKNQKMAKPIKKMRIDVQGTLLNIKVGEQVVFATKDIKCTSIRSGINYLNSKGYLFKSSEKGLINEVMVKREK